MCLVMHTDPSLVGDAIGVVKINQTVGQLPCHFPEAFIIRVCMQITDRAKHGEDPESAFGRVQHPLPMLAERVTVHHCHFQRVLIACDVVFHQPVDDVIAGVPSVLQSGAAAPIHGQVPVPTDESALDLVLTGPMRQRPVAGELIKAREVFVEASVIAACIETPRVAAQAIFDKAGFAEVRGITAQRRVLAPHDKAGAPQPTVVQPTGGQQSPLVFEHALGFWESGFVFRMHRPADRLRRCRPGRVRLQQRAVRCGGGPLLERAIVHGFRARQQPYLMSARRAARVALVRCQFQRGPRRAAVRRRQPIAGPISPVLIDQCRCTKVQFTAAAPRP